MDIRLNFLVRNGTFIVFVLLSAMIAFSAFIRYPETVIVKANLTGTNAPKPVMGHKMGKLMRLLHENGSLVQEKDIIGYLETTANPEEVIACSTIIDSICIEVDKGNFENIIHLMQRKFTDLGELQNQYQSFTQVFIPFRDYVQGGFADKKRALLKNDMNTLAASRNALEEENKLYQKNVSLSQQRLAMSEEMLKEKVISVQEYRNFNSEHIEKQTSLPQIRTTMLANQAQQNEKQKELLDLDNQAKTQQLLFREAAFNMKSAIETWKNDYLIIASITGRLSFAAFLQENQQVEAQKTLGYITPPQSIYFLQAKIPQDNLGRIEKGQSVLLKFPAYPWQEYGSVQGRLDYISPITIDSTYMAKIVLPDGLKTKYNRIVLYQDGLTAQAEIITKDRSLLERFYYMIVSVR